MAEGVFAYIYLSIIILLHTELLLLLYYNNNALVQFLCALGTIVALPKNISEGTQIETQADTLSGGVGTTR